MSIERVVPGGNVREIRARAYANSALPEINLPDSIGYTDETAFDGPDKVTLIATKRTAACDWAVEHGYITAPRADWGVEL